MTETNDSVGTEKRDVHICWNCSQPVSGEPFCSCCSNIQPLPDNSDNFGVLGLRFKRLSLDVESLEDAFYALSRQFHPDRYQNRSPRERQIAEERSASLNVAYRTLRDPVSRTEYLLALESGSHEELLGQPPGELLLEVMEVQETIEAYRSSREESRRVLEDSLRETLLELEDQCARITEELEGSFFLWDRSVLEEGSQAARGSLLEGFRELLGKRRYFKTTIKDIQAALAGQPAPARHGD
jgi:molecular chaperone HscB